MYGAFGYRWFRGQSHRGLMLITHLHLVLRLRKNARVYTSIAQCLHGVAISYADKPLLRLYRRPSLLYTRFPLAACYHLCNITFLTTHLQMQSFTVQETHDVTYKTLLLRYASERPTKAKFKVEKSYLCIMKHDISVKLANILFLLVT
jgi:hypothetical protein